MPLIAIMGLFGLSRMRFGVSAEELKAIVEAQNQPAPPPPSACRRARARDRPARATPARTVSAAPPPSSPMAAQRRG